MINSGIGGHRRSKEVKKCASRPSVTSSDLQWLYWSNLLTLCCFWKSFEYTCKKLYPWVLLLILTSRGHLRLKIYNNTQRHNFLHVYSNTYQKLHRVSKFDQYSHWRSLEVTEGLDAHFLTSCDLLWPPIPELIKFSYPM